MVGYALVCPPAEGRSAGIQPGYDMIFCDRLL
jgi:hypothetical protein